MKNKPSKTIRRPSRLGIVKTVCSSAFALAFCMPAFAADQNTLADVPGISSLESSPSLSVTAAPPATAVSAAAPAATSLMQQAVPVIVVPALKGEAISNDIGNFQFVSKELWRGAQPSHRAIAKLANNGVKTIVDLRLAGSGSEDEAVVAKQYGINYVNIPLGFDNPSLGDIAKFLAIVAKPSNQPVFVHCRQGADRTGTLVGVFRILHDHWSFTAAYNEMRSHHFKPFLLNLKSLVARCEVDSKLSKELIDMAAKLEDTPSFLKVSTKEQSKNI